MSHHQDIPRVEDPPSFEGFLDLSIKGKVHSEDNMTALIFSRNSPTRSSAPPLYFLQTFSLKFGDLDLSS